MGWARKISQSFLKDEPWQLQIDSHMRFAQDWDWHLLNLLARCKSKKPLLTSRTLPYYPDQEDKLKEGLSTYMHPKNFRDNGVLVLTSGAFRQREKLKNPVPGAFISGHYMFSSSKIIHEMPYDEKFAVISTGDEPALAIKAFTRGYDIFYPHKVVVWHHFYRDGAKKNHSEKEHKKKGLIHGGINDLAKEGVKRFVELTSGRIKDERYGLGKERSLLDYKKYCGVDYKNRKMNKDIVRVDGVFKDPKEQKPTSKSTPMPEVNASLTNEGKDKIFVQIASYRDPDIKNTIEHALKMADKPDNLIFGICDQSSKPIDVNIFNFSGQINYEHVDPKDSEGPCWARAKIQEMFNNEDFYLQIDSHMQFQNGWDSYLIDYINKIKMVDLKSHQHPIITCYPRAFEIESLEKNKFKLHHQDQKTHAISYRQDAMFIKNNFSRQIASIAEHEICHGYLIAAGCLFSTREFVTQIPYDPQYYFYGEARDNRMGADWNGWEFKASRESTSSMRSLFTSKPTYPPDGDKLMREKWGKIKWILLLAEL